MINGEEGLDKCQSVIDQAQRGGLLIWTSILTLAEVYKFKFSTAMALAVEQDQIFEEYIASDFVMEAQVDHQIAILARRLCRQHAPLKKPNDGIHLASAVLSNVDEFHTYDREDLLVLNGLVVRVDGKALEMCEPGALVHGATTPMSFGP